MPRFFCENINEKDFTVTGEDAKHIFKVLRYSVGDELILCDMQGKDYRGIIQYADGDTVSGDITEVWSSDTESNINLTLYMAMPKGDKAELIIQKATELGAKEIVFMLTHRCVSRPDDKSFRKKLERFNKISFEAAKQSQRGIIPKVRGLISYKEALAECENKSGIIFYENSTTPLKSIMTNCTADIGVFIGSEGGFEEEEVTMALEKGFYIASLGKRILRCETAPLAAISAIMYEKDNF